MNVQDHIRGILEDRVRVATATRNNLRLTRGWWSPQASAADCRLAATQGELERFVQDVEASQ